MWCFIGKPGYVAVKGRWRRQGAGPVRPLQTGTKETRYFVNPTTAISLQSFHKVHEFNMRLRLTVRRHGLPDAPVVWIVDTSSSPSPTISQLLEAVNEAIPIESDGDWGLEDYAVELKGTNGANYECLHFQHVAAVMKEDDEVMYAFPCP